MIRIIVVVLAVLIAAPLSVAQERVEPKSRGEILLSFAPIVKRTAPAVVNVYAKQIVAQRRGGGMFDDPFFRRFFGDDGSFGRPRERVANSLGSGVIVDPAGLVVTNNHVIKNASDIRVVLSDRREFEAKLILADERTDLAVLQIKTAEDEEFPALAMADSDNLEVGDLVLAIGNPFGVGQTVTSGIVSALARTQVGITDYQFFIQTDAAINPGNSGGALVNMQGQLVGINTAIYSKSGGSIGIGFSIPTNMVRTVVESAAAGGDRIKRPWLGGSFQDVTQEIAESLGFARPEGALVAALHPQSPLARAGLKRGDVIIAVDDRVIENAQELGYRIGTSTIGESRIVEFHRGQQRLEKQVVMLAAPETVPRDETPIAGRTPLAGLRIANLSPAVADELGMDTEVFGVVVLNVDRGPAQRFFRKGDIVKSINSEQMDVVDTLTAFLESQPDYWDIEIIRSNRVLRLQLR
jgi:Do/DeqQ family serine protease